MTFIHGLVDSAGELQMTIHNVAISENNTSTIDVVLYPSADFDIDICDLCIEANAVLDEIMIRDDTDIVMADPKLLESHVVGVRGENISHPISFDLGTINAHSQFGLGKSYLRNRGIDEGGIVLRVRINIEVKIKKARYLLSHGPRVDISFYQTDIENS